MMTREQVLAEMEASFADMPEDLKTQVLYNERGTDWTPALLLEEVRNDTEYGKLYVESWSKNKELRAKDGLLAALLESLLGPPGPNDMTCGQPDCPNCHGEVRPFGQPPSADRDSN